MEERNEGEVREEYVERFGKKFKGKFSGMFVLVGRSPEPLIRDIRAVSPEKVCFIHTPEVEEEIDKVVEGTGLRPSKFKKEKVDGSRPDDTYEVIKRYVREWGKKIPAGRMVLDISGGKKSMVGGAAIAASFYGIEVIYSDYTEYDDEKRIPVPGSEFLASLTNPFEKTMDVRMMVGKRLFNAGEFRQSGRLFREMKQNAVDLELEKRLEFYYELTKMYDRWWNLDFKEAQSSYYKLERLQRYSIDFGVNRNMLEIQHGILDELRSRWDKKREADRFNDPQVMRHIFGTLMAMAEENERDGVFSEQALRLYRVCELIAQHRLIVEHGIDSSDLNWAKVNEDVIKRFQRISFETLKKGNEAGNIRKAEEINLRRKIGLMEGHSLLKALNDSLVEKLDMNKLKSALDFRNNSYLAHGLKPVEKKGVKGLKGIVMGLLQSLYNLVGVVSADKKEGKKDLEGELRKYHPVKIRED